jgi:methyl-accepting chemotaxis protein
MKIRNLLLILLVLIGFIVGIFAMVSYNNMETSNAYVQQAIQKGVFFQKINDDTRQAQVNFQRQVQEWKDTLIRGNDPELYNQYFTNFQNREALVDQGLTKVSADLRDHGINNNIPDDIDTLLKEHAKLGAKYREALASYDRNDPEAGKKVDKLIRGIDRPTSQAMDKVSTEIKQLTEKELASLGTDVNNEHTTTIRNLFISTVLVFIFVVVSCLLIRRQIMNVLGIEPVLLNQYFGELAKGNFKFSLPVQKKDKVSVAYHAKMMHFKLKNLIVSIKNVSDEINTSAGSAKISSSLPEMQEALRETKNGTRGLQDTINKFNV